MFPLPSNNAAYLHRAAHNCLPHMASISPEIDPLCSDLDIDLPPGNRYSRHIHDAPDVSSGNGYDSDLDVFAMASDFGQRKEHLANGSTIHKHGCPRPRFCSSDIDEDVNIIEFYRNELYFEVVDEQFLSSHSDDQRASRMRIDVNGGKDLYSHSFPESASSS